MASKPIRRKRWPVTLPDNLRENLEELAARKTRSFSSIVEDEMRRMIRELGMDPDLPPDEFEKQLEAKGYKPAKAAKKRKQ